MDELAGEGRVRQGQLAQPGRSGLSSVLLGAREERHNLARRTCPERSEGEAVGK